MICGIMIPYRRVSHSCPINYPLGQLLFKSVTVGPEEMDGSVIKDTCCVYRKPECGPTQCLRTINPGTWEGGRRRRVSLSLKPVWSIQLDPVRSGGGRGQPNQQTKPQIFLQYPHSNSSQLSLVGVPGHSMPSYDFQEHQAHTCAYRDAGRQPYIYTKNKIFKNGLFRLDIENYHQILHSCGYYLTSLKLLPCFFNHHWFVCLRNLGLFSQGLHWGLERGLKDSGFLVFQGRFLVLTL